MITPNDWLEMTHKKPISQRSREIIVNRLRGGYSDATVRFGNVQQARDDIKGDFSTLIDLGFDIWASDGQYTIKF